MNRKLELLGRDFPLADDRHDREREGIKHIQEVDADRVGREKRYGMGVLMHKAGSWLECDSKGVISSLCPLKEQAMVDTAGYDML